MKTPLSSQVGNIFIPVLNVVFSVSVSIVFFLRESFCFPAAVKTRSIPPPDPGQPSYHPFYHIRSNERSNELLLSHKVIPRREIPFSPLSDNWMCQTYCVRTWPKYTGERYPKKYIVKSMRIHTNTNTIYQQRWKSWSLRRTASAATIFLILSSPQGCICLTSLKITSTQDRLYAPSVTSSMNSLSSSSFLDMDRDLFFRHHDRSWTWTDPYSFEQATWQTWSHTARLLLWSRSDKCARQCNPPTDAFGDDAGARFVRTDWVTSPVMTLVRASVRLCRLRLTFPWHVFFQSTGTMKSRWSRTGTSKIILDYIRFLFCHMFGPDNQDLFTTSLPPFQFCPWFSAIIKLKLSWLSRSMILPLGTFPWLSLSVTHAKNSLKDLILIILSTYQAW